ncbi:MAG: membrane protein insertion efficiency factor YidD [Pseudomonadales bacterium]
MPKGVVARTLHSLIRGYQLFISPMLGPQHCRYYPSCSEYARQALLLHGPIKGTYLAIGRLLRCNPFSYGGVDPVPGQVIPTLEEQSSQALAQTCACNSYQNSERIERSK